jgi:hypothetical protein
MVARLLALSVDARDPEAQTAFWGGLLERPVDGPVVRAGADPEFELRFGSGATDKVQPNWIHLHLTSAAPGDQERTVARALGLGATHLDVGQTPDELHVVLADPEGNEFCVIEAGNRFLAGTGFLGELACDGTRDVGLFWSAALDWPLNWDQDEETSIQSPLGGTKVSWGGPPVRPKTGRRMWFELGAADGDVERLVGLGATRLRDGVLADPDGNEFAVRAEG